jgi:hypothetical protein
MHGGGDARAERLGSYVSDVQSRRTKMLGSDVQLSGRGVDSAVISERTKSQHLWIGVFIFLKKNSRSVLTPNPHPPPKKKKKQYIVVSSPCRLLDSTKSTEWDEEDDAVYGGGGGGGIGDVGLTAKLAPGPGTVTSSDTSNRRSLSKAHRKQPDLFVMTGKTATDRSSLSGVGSPLHTRCV